ncbi:MAG: class I SAM-dependent methyltransferase [Novosphingobium sp.]|nr:class I SAM-dependent methyltransferase [Novosphingobium sp.]
MWDERFAEPDHAYGTEPNDFLVECRDRLTPGACLCLAEGQGRNAVWLAGQGFEVTAIDQSAVGLGRARDLAVARGVAIQTQVADLCDFDMGGELWDTIVSIFAHLPPAIRRNVHQRAVEALKPGGTLCFEAYSPAKFDHPGKGGPPRDQADRLVPLDELKQDFAGLSFDVAREIVREVNEGTYHTGQSAVIQILARKTG